MTELFFITGNENKFKEVSEAYRVLSDAEKRQQYDQFGRVFSAEGGPASGWEPKDHVALWRSVFLVF